MNTSSRSLLESNRVSLGVAFSDATEDLFGLGVNPEPDLNSRWKATRGALGLGVARELSEEVTLRLGWRVVHVAARELTGALASSVTPGDLTSLWFSGAEAELAFDSRDSLFTPKRGYLMSVGGFFPTETLASSLTYKEFRVASQAHFRLSGHTWMSFSGDGTFLDGDVPLTVVPRLRPGFLSFVREGRLQGRGLITVGGEVFQEIWGPLTLVGELGIATASPTLSDLFGHWMPGFGMGLLLPTDRLRSRFIRVDVGRFGSETTVAILGGKAL